VKSNRDPACQGYLKLISTFTQNDKTGSTSNKHKQFRRTVNGIPPSMCTQDSLNLVPRLNSKISIPNGYHTILFNMRSRGSSGGPRLAHNPWPFELGCLLQRTVFGSQEKNQYSRYTRFTLIKDR